MLAIRPESIRLGPCVDRVERVDRLNRVEASVIDRVFLGDAVRITVEAAGQRLQVYTSPEQAQGVVGGQRVTVTLPPDRLRPVGPR
jgi:ABC-type Fe3+/spermidine/putrescine transport system ATPase subunit